MGHGTSSIGFYELFKRHAAIMDPGLVRLGPLSAGLLGSATTSRRSASGETFASAAFELFDVDRCCALRRRCRSRRSMRPRKCLKAVKRTRRLPWITWTPYTYPFNISGQPAISIPCGVTKDHMPVGIADSRAVGRRCARARIRAPGRSCARVSRSASAADSGSRRGPTSGADRHADVTMPHESAP